MGGLAVGGGSLGIKHHLPGRTEAPRTRTCTRMCMLIRSPRELEALWAPQRGHGCYTATPNQPATVQTHGAPGTGGLGPPQHRLFSAWGCV